jgi:hypothetical protein
MVADSRRACRSIGSDKIRVPHPDPLRKERVRGTLPEGEGFLDYGEAS